MSGNLKKYKIMDEDSNDEEELNNNYQNQNFRNEIQVKAEQSIFPEKSTKKKNDIIETDTFNSLKMTTNTVALKVKNPFEDNINSESEVKNKYVVFVKENKEQYNYKDVSFSYLLLN